MVNLGDNLMGLGNCVCIMWHGCVFVCLLVCLFVCFLYLCAVEVNWEGKTCPQWGPEGLDRTGTPKVNWYLSPGAGELFIGIRTGTFLTLGLQVMFGLWIRVVQVMKPSGLHWALLLYSQVSSLYSVCCQISGSPYCVNQLCKCMCEHGHPPVLYLCHLLIYWYSFWSCLSRKYWLV